MGTKEESGNGRIGSAVTGLLVNIAHLARGREICGFLVRERQYSSLVIHPIPNVSEKDSEFEMDRDALVEFYRQRIGARDDIIAMYHSHPKGATEPSLKDIEYAPKNTPLEMRYFIITDTGVFEWDLDEDGRVRHGIPVT